MPGSALVDMHTEIEYSVRKFFTEKSTKALTTVDKNAKKGYNV